MRTKDKVADIISEVEEKNVEVRKIGEGYTMSAQDIANIYIGQGVRHKLEIPPTEVSGNDRVLMIELGEINARNQTTFARPFPGGGIRKIVSILKKIYWKVRVKLVRPMFDEQNAFNGHTVSALNELNRIRCEYEYELANLRESVRLISGQNNALTERIDKLQGIIDAFGLTRGVGLSDVEYEEFENNFRGVEEDIAERLKIYLPYYRDSKLPVMEIGSGRGEFLTLLRELNVKSFGVDVFEPFVNKCLKKGLDVKLGDGVSYMNKICDESLGGLFASQVIEHISTEELIALCKEAYRCLQPGAYVIFETPNPTCASIFTNSFYIDPSHQKPVHPSLIEYIMKVVGFKDVQIVYTEGSKSPISIPELKVEGAENIDEFNKAMSELNTKIFGSQDYAVIARKA